MIEDLTSGGTLLSLILANTEELVRDVKVGGNAGCSDREMPEFRILRGGTRAKIRIASLDFRREDIGLFRSQLQSMPWDMVLERRGEKEKKWLISKDYLLQAQEWSICMCRRKSSKGGRKPVRMNKELWTKLKHKKEASRGGNKVR